MYAPRKLTAGYPKWWFGKSGSFLNMAMFDAPRKINIEPENDGLEAYFPFPGVYSQVPC